MTDTATDYAKFAKLYGNQRIPDPDKWATSPFSSVNVEGIGITSRWQKQDDFDLAANLLWQLPHVARQWVQSVYMDSPHDHHTFRLKKVSAAVAENRAYYLGRVLRNLQLKIRGGSNGTYVEYDDAAGDTQTHVAIEGDWPYSTDDNTNGKRPPEACIDAEVERSIWGLHEAAESLFDCQCFSGLHTERPARGAGAGRA